MRLVSATFQKGGAYGELTGINEKGSPGLGQYEVPDFNTKGECKMGTKDEAEERSLTDREKFRVRESMLMELGVVEGPVDLPEEITLEEHKRVSANWRNHPGAVGSFFLESLGEALFEANQKQAAKLKAAFPDEWKRWNGEFDPKTGARLED